MDLMQSGSVSTTATLLPWRTRMRWDCKKRKLEPVPQTGYRDYREMLDKERPQIVAVCPRWTDQHRDMVLACAESGCHMYMEKPFCRTLGEADEMIQACEMRHLKLAVAHISRYSPQLDVIRRLIQAGEIGDVLEIRARGKEDARGGAEDLWVLGTHVLDLMRAFGGEPASCFATLYQDGQRVTGEHVHPGNEGLGPLAGDRVDAMYRFQTGITGYFSSQKAAGGNPNRFGSANLWQQGHDRSYLRFREPRFPVERCTMGIIDVTLAHGRQSPLPASTSLSRLPQRL